MYGLGSLYSGLNLLPAPAAGITIFMLLFIWINRYR
jgi:hypothetical protein